MNTKNEQQRAHVCTLQAAAAFLREYVLFFGKMQGKNRFPRS